jgi:hypothetical protein
MAWRSFPRSSTNDDLLIAGEWPLAGQQLIQDHSQREDVAAMIDGLAGGLLRRHVGHGAHDLPLFGEHGGTLDLGQAKIHYLYLSILCNHDVVALDVPVNDAAGVGRTEGLTCGHDYIYYLQRVGPMLLQQLAQGSALNILHGDVLLALVLAHIIDGDDSRVIQQGACPGLPKEPLPHLLLGKIHGG